MTFERSVVLVNPGDARHVPFDEGAHVAKQLEEDIGFGTNLMLEVGGARNCFRMDLSGPINLGGHLAQIDPRQRLAGLSTLTSPLITHMIFSWIHKTISCNKVVEGYGAVEQLGVPEEFAPTH